ncbi:(Fe-S)-binding protein [Desulfofundulus thermobenzoicus]|uniref:(Fe-S)-binding protein n=1 Tax=Desulfofundulus thermobenzoicus TaxID=29376 RepID=A0A6N7IUV7_9FIRM|nr:(Fe-S)-binding protein [Desulfofundulus thermobenzoicus]MQL53905.1 (Fe-S)-binding protein [Desulfofundulus thermobenzoicus]
MPLPKGDTIGILADNLRIRQSVLPISARRATGWAAGLSLPRGGETVFYTGLMYQMVPDIAAMSRMQGRIENSWIAGFVGVGRCVNKVVNIAAFMARPDRELKLYCDGVLKNIALLLRQVGVDFGYLYEEELYSGALVYDLGVNDLLEGHGQKIAGLFVKYGVKNVITVDPHTTNMLRTVLPAIVKGFHFNVKSYLEVLAERGIQPARSLEQDLVIHDSCLYARHEGVVDEPRALLNRAGAQVKEPKNAGKFTMCCGGPVESLMPGLAVDRARMRMAQLKEVAQNGVTMCPLCYVNLHKAAPEEMHIEDISSYLVKSYLK